MIAQARRLTQAPYHAQYQVILSDIYGADGGQPSNTTYPCTNGNCANWVTFVGDVVERAAGHRAHVRLRHLERAGYLRLLAGPARNTTQYFQMWDSAYKEIRQRRPERDHRRPVDFAFTPQQNQGEWQGFLSNAKSAGTVPTEITNHEEGDGDDPVADSSAINSDLSAAGISPAPRCRRTSTSRRTGRPPA